MTVSSAKQFLVHFEVKIAPLLTVALNNFWSWDREAITGRIIVLYLF